MLSFVNDYSELCHPRVLARLAEDNFEPQPGYGTDEICARATARIREACKAPEAEVARYEKRLRQQAAACLRRGSGGALWACALCLEALKGQRDEEVSV